MALVLLAQYVLSLFFYDTNGVVCTIAFPLTLVFPLLVLLNGTSYWLGPVTCFIHHSLYYDDGFVMRRENVEGNCLYSALVSTYTLALQIITVEV